jgi:hypothetical protein
MDSLGSKVAVSPVSFFEPPALAFEDIARPKVGTARAETPAG